MSKKYKQMVVFFCEGDTEKPPFKKILDYLISISSKKIPVEDPINVKGSGKCRDMPVKIMQKRYLKSKEFIDFSFIVFIAFDTDVSEYSPKPPLSIYL
ncbi:hypothetical protein ELD05_02775 [Caldicellulosiruptor changbaiensis]|uniref:DUF4276 family protein n=1 Tax=Caldicellulosiruptor changbaiensis TaxID=1222016 RepID=A0A3T0D371_9FIRM|nr:hypothetical protein [Caldicellulosiruptor changbaiensis]AZT89665.1 hypothetical protein ELD05_02775 [Caldicellulosiruptor changbaiensis]